MDVAGKRSNGEYWFKSDQYLTNLSNAVDFCVKRPFLFKWRGWYLWAKLEEKYQYYDYSVSAYRTDTSTSWRRIGIYKNIASASLALEEVMKILDIISL